MLIIYVSYSKKGGDIEADKSQPSTLTRPRQAKNEAARDLEMLELAAAAGEIDLLLGDESGCSMWSQSSLCYYFRGEQKRQEQTKKRGKRLNLIGTVATRCFVCILGLGSWRGQDFIELINGQAQIAAEIYQRTGRSRVIVLDNGSIHTSRATETTRMGTTGAKLVLFTSLLFRDEPH